MCGRVRIYNLVSMKSMNIILKAASIFRYEGTLCNECEDGYGRMNENDCYKCQKKSVEYIRLIGGWIAIIAIGLGRENSCRFFLIFV